MSKAVYINARGRIRFCEHDGYDPMPEYVLFADLQPSKQTEVTEFQNAQWEWNDGTPERVVREVDTFLQALNAKSQEIESKWNALWASGQTFTTSSGDLLFVDEEAQKKINYAAAQIAIKARNGKDLNVETMTFVVASPPYIIDDKTCAYWSEAIEEFGNYYQQKFAVYSGYKLQLAACQTEEEINNLGIEL